MADAQRKGTRCGRDAVSENTVENASIRVGAGQTGNSLVQLCLGQITNGAGGARFGWICKI